MRDILQKFPKKNCKVGGIMILVSSGLIGGAGVCYTKSPQPILAFGFFIVAILYAGLGILLLKKSKQP
jgi:hypothetical protein